MNRVNITYVASSGNTYNMMTSFRTRTANFHNWEYTAQAVQLLHGERVSTFRKKAVTYEVELVVSGTDPQRRAMITAFHDDIERDIKTLSPGKVIYGDWYINCYVIENELNPDEEVNRWTNNKMSIYVPSGYWYRDLKHEFRYDREAGPSLYLDYTYDYSYDYTEPTYGTYIWDTDIPFVSDFEMVIYGPCVNPRVLINKHVYMVYATVPDGEALVVNSKEHTVMIGDYNAFDDRYKAESIFDQIPGGELRVDWGSFDMDITLFNERSSPKWS